MTIDLVKVKVGNFELNGLLDSGSSCSILGKGSESLIDQLTLPRYNIIVVPTLSKPLILGMDFWNAFNVKAVCCSIEADPVPVDKNDLTTEQSSMIDQAIKLFKASKPGQPLGKTH